MASLKEEEEEVDYLGDLSRFVQPHDLPLPLPSNPSSAITGTLKGAKGKLGWQGKRKLKRQEQQKVEEQQLSEGLKLAIPSSNIGFKMLQQMGYTPGVALGKHGQGSLEPIELGVKRSRTGLGRDSVEKAEKEQKAKSLELQLARNRNKQEELSAGFKERRRDSWQRWRIASNYRKACTALLQLEETDSTKSRKNGEEITKSQDEFTERESTDTVLQNEEYDQEDKDDDSEEEITPEALQEVLDKLRNIYYYCLYCGCQYESAESLLANCPGLEEDDH